MTKIWRFIEKRLAGNDPAMLIVVTDVKGSSPGKKGFKMAVAPDGTSAGSIGGGQMEYAMTALAREKLRESPSVPFIKKQVHAAEAGKDASGLICSGEQLHAFMPLASSELDKIRSLIQAQESESGGLLELSSSGLFFTENTGQHVAKAGETAAGDWYYSEKISPPETLYIFGGGHISIPMSQVCCMLGFRVVVLDNREHLVTMKNNTFAHDKKTIDYREAIKYIRHPDTAYVCIMTASHATDQDILEQMLTSPLRYLGMIGSKKKVRQIFSNLLAKGFSEEKLQHVNAPMGIAINSETPEEIAISIAAGIIRQKHLDWT